MRTKIVITLCLTASLLATGRPAAAVEKMNQPETATADAAAKREKERLTGLVRSQADTLVTVDVILSQTSVFDGKQMPSFERRMQLPGTLVDASGLTVISHSPLRSPPVRTPFGHDGRSTFTMQQQVHPKEMKIVLNDGTELPASVALVDSDLDLAFVRPLRPAQNLAHVTLDPSVHPSLLDDVASLSRLSSALGRAAVIHPGQILCVISKPRTRYLVGPGATTGCPFFDESNRCFGILLAVPDSGSVDKFNVSMSAARAVLPAADILQEIKQIRDK